MFVPFISPFPPIGEKYVSVCNKHKFFLEVTIMKISKIPKKIKKKRGKAIILHILAFLPHVFLNFVDS